MINSVSQNPFIVSVADESVNIDPTELGRIINVTFMPHLEIPDLSCVYRVRSGDTLQSIMELVLTKRMQRKPTAVEIEEYALQVTATNELDVKNLIVGSFIMLPIQNVGPLTSTNQVVEHVSDSDDKLLESGVHGVHSVVTPPGLNLDPGETVQVSGKNIAGRNLRSCVDENSGAISYVYSGELAVSFCGLFRTFFIATETFDQSDNLLCSRIEYDGFGTWLKFSTIAGYVSFGNVRSIDTQFDQQSSIYQSSITCADGVVHRLITSSDGTRSWRA